MRGNAVSPAIRVLVCAALCLAVPLPAIGADRAIDIRDFGAAGDGKTLCTAAIQRAIDQCAARGGGTVRLPEGTWLTGTVYPQSNLTLVLEKGCTLLGSRKHEDYGRARASADAAGPRTAPFRCAAVLASSDLQNVTIRGEGAIDGQGDAFRDKSKLRPKNLYLQRCRNVVLRDIAAENTSQTGCSITGLPGHPIRDVVLENVRIGSDGGGTKDLARRAIPEREDGYPECTMFGPLPAYGLYCRHVEGLVLRKVEVRTRQADLRHALVFDDVKRLEIESLEAGCAKGAAAVLRLAQVEGAVLRRSIAPAHADPFLLLEGDRTRQIVLEQLDLSRAVQGVHLGVGASAQAVSSGGAAPDRGKP